MQTERWYDPPEGGQSLFMIDDCLNVFEDKKLSELIEELYIRRSHHQLANIAFICQDPFRGATSIL